MKKLGYRNHPRMRPLNLDHLKKVIMTYARFHAIFFGYRQYSPNAFDAACDKLGNPLQSINLEPILNEQDYFQKLVYICDEKKEYLVKSKIKYLAKMVENPEVGGPLSCTIHGDCEINNYMFSYNPNGTVKDVCLVDFQFARLGPLIYDLSYFIFACISPLDLGHFDELKDLYYTTFNECFETLGFTQREVFTKAEYERQWLVHARFGLRMMFSVMKNQLATNEEICDLVEVAANAVRGNEVEGAVFEMEELDDRPTKCTYSNDLIRRCAERTFPIVKFAIERQFI